MHSTTTYFNVYNPELIHLIYLILVSIIFLIQVDQTSPKMCFLKWSFEAFFDVQTYFEFFQPYFISQGITQCIFVAWTLTTSFRTSFAFLVSSKKIRLQVINHQDLSLTSNPCFRQSPTFRYHCIKVPVIEPLLLR